MKFFLPVVLLAAYVGLPAAPADSCTVIVPDVQYRCTGRALEPSRHNVTYMSWKTDNIMASNAKNPLQAGDVVVATNRLLVEHNWVTRVANSSPNYFMMISAREKNGCDSTTGRSCSYGRTTLWLDIYEPSSGTWLLTNLAHFYGFNSESLGWSAWLHGKKAIFNLLVRAEGSGWYTTRAEHNPQIYTLDVDPGVISVSKFAPGQLEDANCLTGRVDAVPNLVGNSCFDGQRIIFVRRCNDGESTNAYWNNTSYDGTGGACIPGADRTYSVVPVLRTYVVELNAACSPKKSWANNGISPLREPPTDDIHKQMGVITEWGDMLASISPDGKYAAVATNFGPPANSSPCAGFYYNLQDASVANSGASARRISWCRLRKDPVTGQISSEGPLTLLSPFGMEPPETTLLPSFFPIGNTMSLLFTARWAQLNHPGFSSVMQTNLESDYQLLYFGTPDGANMGSIQAIHRSAAR